MRPKVLTPSIPVTPPAAMLQTAYMPNGKTVDRRRVS